MICSTLKTSLFSQTILCFQLDCLGKKEEVNPYNPEMFTLSAI